MNFRGMAGGGGVADTRMPKWYQDEQKELHASKGGAHRSNSGYFGIFLSTKMLADFVFWFLFV